MCRLVGVDPRCTHHVQRRDNLWRQFVPKLQREISIGCRQRRNKSILECLNCTFGGVDAVVVRFDKLKLAFLFGEENLNLPCRLIVHYV